MPHACSLYATSTVGQLPRSLPPPDDSDGDILHIVPADEEELEQAMRWAQDPQRRTEPGCITVVPQRVRELRDLLLDVASLQSLRDERPEIKPDQAVQREVIDRLPEAQQSWKSASFNQFSQSKRRQCATYQNLSLS